MNLGIGLELFIFLNALITLAIIGWLGFFLVKRDKNYFNEKREPGKKVRKIEGFVAQKNTDPDNPYNILGVPVNTTQKEVLKAYRRKLKQYHPDVVSHRGNEWSEMAKQKTLKIQWAKEQILNHLKAA